MKEQITKVAGYLRQLARKPRIRSIAVIVVVTVVLLKLLEDPIYRVTDLLLALWEDRGTLDPISLGALLMLLPAIPFLLLFAAFCIPFGDPAPLEYQAVQIQNVSTIPVTFIEGDDRLARKGWIRASALCGNRTFHLEPGAATSIEWGYAIKNESPNRQLLPLYAIAVDRDNNVVFSETYTYDQLKAADWTMKIVAHKTKGSRESDIEDSYRASPRPAHLELTPCSS